MRLSEVRSQKQLAAAVIDTQRRRKESEQRTQRCGPNAGMESCKNMAPYLLLLFILSPIVFCYADASRLK